MAIAASQPCVNGFSFVRRIGDLRFVFLVQLAMVASQASAQTNIQEDTPPGFDTNTVVSAVGNVHWVTGGEAEGGNLFHSLAEFDLGTGDTVNLTATPSASTGSILNVITRVRSGTASDIDGIFIQTEAPNADSFVINPSGLVFGTAEINAPNSVLFSTAHELRFDVGSSFSTITPDGSTYATASPTTAGFLGGQGDIDVNGQITIGALTTELALIGADINVSGGIDATGAALNLTAIGTGAESVSLTNPTPLSGNGTISVVTGASLAADEIFLTAETVSIEGTLNVVGQTSQVVGDLSSASGLINLQDGDATTELSVTGDAQFDGAVQFDVDLGAGAADVINVSGALSGDVDLAFNNIGGIAEVVDLDLFTYGTTNALTFSSITGLPTDSPIDYFIQDNGSGAVQLQSQVNSGVANLAVAVGQTSTLLNAIFADHSGMPDSHAFALGEASRCGDHVWTKVLGGRADAAGAYTDQSSGQMNTSPVSLNYGGMVVGGNVACFDGLPNGGRMILGGYLGLLDGQSANTIFAVDPLSGLSTGVASSMTQTDFQQRFAGVTASVTQGAFFANLGYRLDATQFTSTNTEIIAGSGIDLQDENYSSQGHTISGNLGYTWPVGSVPGLTFTGAGGFSHTRFGSDVISLGADGELVLAEGESTIAFVSGTIARTLRRPSSNGSLSYFATVSVFNDFSDGRGATLAPSAGASRDIALAGAGTYNTLSLGLNYETKLASAEGFDTLNVALTVDAMAGDAIENLSMSAEVSLQF